MTRGARPKNPVILSEAKDLVPLAIGDEIAQRSLSARCPNTAWASTSPRRARSATPAIAPPAPSILCRLRLTLADNRTIHDQRNPVRCFAVSLKGCTPQGISAISASDLPVTRLALQNLVSINSRNSRNFRYPF
jgi:hypothetical protein